MVVVGHVAQSSQGIAGVGLDQVAVIIIIIIIIIDTITFRAIKTALPRKPACPREY